MSSVVISGDTSGSVTLSAPATAGSTVLTLPVGTATLTANGLNSNIVAGTSQATSSGTTKSFTGIPSWVKRITVMFNAITTNGGNHLQVQIGSGSFATTGYTSYFGYFTNSNGTATADITSGIGLWHQGTNDVLYGNMVITNISGNTWIASHGGGFNNGINNYALGGSGSITLSGVLDRIQLATTSTDNFSGSGSVNILYE